MNSNQKNVVISTLGSTLTPKRLIDVYINNKQVRDFVDEQGFDFTARTRNNILAECLKQSLGLSKVWNSSDATSVAFEALTSLMSVNSLTNEIGPATVVETASEDIRPITIVPEVSPPDPVIVPCEMEEDREISAPARKKKKKSKRTRSEVSTIAPTTAPKGNNILPDDITIHGRRSFNSAVALSLSGTDGFEIGGSCGKRHVMSREIQPNEGKELTVQMNPVTKLPGVYRYIFQDKLQMVELEWREAGSPTDIKHTVNTCEGSCIICDEMQGSSRQRRPSPELLKHSPFLALWIECHLLKYDDFNWKLTLPSIHGGIKLDLRQSSITEERMLGLWVEYATSTGLQDIELITAKNLLDAPTH